MPGLTAHTYPPTNGETFYNPTPGQATAAQSQSVAPCSDIPFDTTASTFARVIASNTITRPPNTSPYSNGLVVGTVAGGAAGRFQFAGVGLRNAGLVRIDRCRLYKSSLTASGTFVLWVYRGDPAASGVADQATASNQLVVGNAGAATRLVGRFAFDMTGAAIGTDGAEVSGVSISGSSVLAQCGTGSQDLFGVLVATSAYTPASNETFSVVMEAYAF